MSLTAYASLKTPHCGVFRAFGAPQPPFGLNTSNRLQFRLFWKEFLPIIYTRHRIT